MAHGQFCVWSVLVCDYVSMGTQLNARLLVEVSPIWREPGSLLGATSETPQSELQRSTPPFRVPVSRNSLIPRGKHQGFASQKKTRTPKGRSFPRQKIHFLKGSFCRQEYVNPGKMNTERGGGFGRFWSQFGMPRSLFAGGNWGLGWFRPKLQTCNLHYQSYCLHS